MPTTRLWNAIDNSVCPPESKGKWSLSDLKTSKRILTLARTNLKLESSYKLEVFSIWKNNWGAQWQLNKWKICRGTLSWPLAFACYPRNHPHTNSNCHHTSFGNTIRIAFQKQSILSTRKGYRRFFLWNDKY